ncbi:uncharacterized protein LOC123661896 [Melitaea cinxia]|uniref:uncharacterized protein LOC123661896 n=1 Tax=Melitaea cinxia TaxID=113334 RepID=UPI001E2718F0|nr:uncharacterized protein LOC123661896 [Melitaea cinxia]
MNIPEIKPYEEQAVDMLVSVINRAKETLGVRQTLKQLAKSRDVMTPQAKVLLTTLECPLVITSEQLLRQTIEKKWRLTDVFMYVLKYIGSSNDECSQYYYFEAIFSQPTAAYPIPQVTASVFFRVEDKHTEPPEIRGVPLMTFRIEGHRSDHDVRFVTLIPDWILAVIQMKIKLFRRIEELRMF